MSTSTSLLKRFRRVGTRAFWEQRRRIRERPELLEFAEETVERYHDQGYLLFDPEIPESLLDAVVAEMKKRPEVQENLRHGSRVFDGWENSNAIRQVALAPRVHRLLKRLYGRTPLPFQTLNFPVGTQQRLHSDTIHFNSDPPTFMCGVWVALEDIDENNGPLIFYPGSHKLKQVAMEDVADGPGREHYKAYENYIEKMIADSGLKPKYGVMKKGQAVIWAANLVHGGAPHNDKSRTRYSQVTHFYFEGCQYFTPMHSYGGYRCLRQPNWIK